MKTRYITREMLQARNACIAQRDLFAELFPNGAEITVALCVQHARDFNWGWAAGNMLSETAQEAYDEARALGRAACDVAREAARKVCDKARATAWEAYDKAPTSARKAYDEVRTPAWKAYDEAYTSAWKVYDEACAAAWKAHDEAHATAFATAFLNDNQHSALR